MIAIMRASNIIYDSIGQTQIQQEIDKLHKRIDSTNTLLLEILKELRGKRNGG